MSWPFTVYNDDDIMNELFALRAQLTQLNSRVGALSANFTNAVSHLTKMEKIMSSFDDALAGLRTQVAANTSAEGSAVTLIQQLAALIAANVSDPAKLTELSTQLKASADALAAAVTANTPAAPAA
jgi:hypothetical protein